MPQVSVLLPIHRAGATLEACLETIRRQTFEDWECILADDGSDDDSLDIARRFADADRRFVPLPGPHLGLVGTLERGRAACRGAWIARMDADDLMLRERLHLQARALEGDPDLAAVGAHVRIFPRAEMGGGLRAYEHWLRSVTDARDVAREAFVECPVAHPTWMIRRSILDRYGYRDQGWPEDYDLLLRLLADGHRFGVIARPLVAWREHPARLTHNHDAYRIGEFPRLKAHFLRHGFLAGRRTYVLWGYGHTGRALRRALTDYDLHPSHIVEVHPGRLGQRIHGADVIPPSRLPQLRGERVVTSVAGAGPRSEVRSALREMGFHELRDFVCAA